MRKADIHQSKLEKSWTKVMSRFGIIHNTVEQYDPETTEYVRYIACDLRFRADSGYFKKCYEADKVSCAACLAVDNPTASH